MMLPRPRAYVDWTVPLDDQGGEIVAAKSSDEYRFYLQWLADYLYKSEIPLPPNQQALFEEYMERGVDYAIIDLSDMLGYSIWDLDIIENMIEEGRPFKDLQQSELDLWNGMSDEEKEIWADEEVFTSEEDLLRIRQEYLESKTVPSHIRHADIPYRPILAAFFKEIPDAGERYRLLNLFYRNFNECADK